MMKLPGFLRHGGALAGLLLLVQSSPAECQVLKTLDQDMQRIASSAQCCCVRIDVVRVFERAGDPSEKADAGGNVQAGNDSGGTAKPLELQFSLSGILLDGEGNVATLGEALDGAKRIWVSVFSKDEPERYKADVIGTSVEYNIGLVRIRDASNLTTLPLGDSDTLAQGAIVFGLGCTYSLGPSPSFYVGVVHATDRVFKFKQPNSSQAKLIQTSLPLHPGETGGPLVNANCEIVGLLLTRYAPPSAFAGQPGLLDPSARYCTLALPINRVKEVAAWILAQHGDASAVSEGKEPEEPWLGFTGGEITDEALRKQLQLPAGGVLVSYVFPGDPAARAGILVNDVLLQWDGEAIRGIDHLRELVGSVRKGDRVKLRIVRGGQQLDLVLQIGGY